MADTKISDLTAATTLADTDLFVIAQEDTANKKVTFPTLRDEVLPDPVFDAFGTPDTAFEFDTSSFTGLTALGSPDAENADTTIPDHYFIRDDGAGLKGRYASSPATPWTAITLVTGHTLRAGGNPQVCLWIAEASPGALDIMYQISANREIKTARWTNTTTYSADINASGVLYTEPPLYMAVRANSGTSFDFLFSFNGLVWWPITSARNPSLTIGSIGIGINPHDGSYALTAAFDYLRIWNSALTFPGVP